MKAEEERKPPGAICHLRVSALRLGFNKNIEINGQQIISAKIMTYKNMCLIIELTMCLVYMIDKTATNFRLIICVA